MCAYNQFEEKLNQAELQESFFQTLSKETDRGLAIVSVCYLDALLENLIKSFFIKDTKIKVLFKDDHLLQSFYAKTNIAYFSGLIPEIIYRDLKLLGEIRNKFAHATISDISFSDEKISQIIDRLAQLSNEVIKVYPPRLKHTLIVTHIGALLRAWTRLLHEIKVPRPIDIFKFDKLAFEDMILTPSQIIEIIRKEEEKSLGENSNNRNS